MKSIILKSDKPSLDALDSIIQQIYLNVGDWFYSKPIETGRIHTAAGTENLFLKIFQGGQFPVCLDLPERENNLSLVRHGKKLAYLECNKHPIVYFAVEDGVFSIPKDFSGTLFYELSYETVFPDFAALPNLTGLGLSGYCDNISDWANLAKASKIKLFTTPAYEAPWARLLNCHLKTLHCTSAFFKELDASLLQDVNTLYLEGGNNEIFERVFRLPSLQRFFLNSTFQLPAKKDRIPLCTSLLRIIDPAFPETLPQLGKEECNNYSEYMTSITEYITKYGNENAGMEVKRIYETTGDYPMESNDFLEICPYGISDYGSLYFKQNNGTVSIDFKIGTTRDKALAMLSEIAGLNSAIMRDEYRDGLKHEIKNIVSSQTEFKDPNRKEFEEKTQLFRHKIDIFIIPLFNYAAKELKEQGIEVDYRLDIDSRDDIRNYSASVWFSIYKSGRSTWTNFQCNQTAYRLEPINVSIWNPEKWENENKEFKLEEMTSECITLEFFAFLKSLSKFFKYEWES